MILHSRSTGVSLLLLVFFSLILLRPAVAIELYAGQIIFEDSFRVDHAVRKDTRFDDAPLRRELERKARLWAAEKVLLRVDRVGRPLLLSDERIQLSLPEIKVTPPPEGDHFIVSGMANTIWSATAFSLVRDAYTPSLVNEVRVGRMKMSSILRVLGRAGTRPLRSVVGDEEYAKWRVTPSTCRYTFGEALELPTSLTTPP